MPRSLTSAHATAVTQVERQFVELYQVTLVTSDVYYLANQEVDVASHASTGGHPWTAFPITRQAMQGGATLEVDKMTASFANREVSFTGTNVALGTLAIRGILDGGEVRLFYIDQGNPAGGLFTHSVWTIQGAEADRAQVTVHLEGQFAKLVALTPRRTWQEQCNWALFSEWCTLTRGDWTVHATVASGSTVDVLRFSVMSAGGSVPATIPGSWFELGQVRFTSGPNAGLRRTIRTQSEAAVNSAAQVSAVTMLLSLPVTPVQSDVVNLVPGCNKTLDHCVVKFNNVDNFGGFPRIPRPEVQFGV